MVELYRYKGFEAIQKSLYKMDFYQFKHDFFKLKKINCM